MTHSLLKQFFKAIREPSWVVFIFFSVVLVCLAIVFVVLIITQTVIWNTPRQIALPSQPDSTSTVTEQNSYRPGIPTVSAYVVQPGDTLWSIAEEMYGEGEKYVEISEVNNLPEPDLLIVGQNLVLPEVTPSSLAPIDEAEPTGQPQADATYVVQPGDSLWVIAGTTLDSPYQWVEVYELNRQVVGSNPDLIFPGQQLMLPRTNSAQK